MRFIYFRILFLLLLLGCLSCSRTRLTEVWVDPRASTLALNNILVVGITRSEAGRRNFETELVRLLKQEGLNARPSYEIVSSGEASLEHLKPLLTGTKTDAILVSRIVGFDEDLRYVPGVSTGYYGFYDRYFYHSYYHPFFYEPGSYVLDVEVILETNLYAAESGELIWSAQSETADPASAESLARSLGPNLIRELRKQGVLKKKVRTQ